jgi:Leucine-rich repeat (LRR) protein
MFLAFNDLDCSMYTSDKQIIQSLPFKISINPTTFNIPILTYARVDNQGRVIELNITSIENMPLSIFCLKSLQSLTLQYSNNLSIPSEIGRVASSLTSLNLIRISDALTLPSELFNLTKLTTLSIVSCGLEALSDDIEKLFLLSNLTLTANRLRTLPASLSTMMLLSSVTVDSNSALSSLDALSRSRSMTQLRASYCAIDHLPSDMPNLGFIEMRNNSLTSLEGLETLGWLYGQSFIFTNNKITTIPFKNGRIQRLNNFELTNNLLAELHEAFYNIVDLKTIDLRNNKFDEKETEWIRGRFRPTTTTVFL